MTLSVISRPLDASSPEWGSFFVVKKNFSS